MLRVLLVSLCCLGARAWEWDWQEATAANYDSLYHIGRFQGTAPACGTTQLCGDDHTWFDPLGCGNGEECLSGKKVYCHPNPSPFASGTWTGTAPACGASCGSCVGDLSGDCLVLDKCGSGASCFLGGWKAFCSKPQPGSLRVNWVPGTAEGSELDSGKVTVTIAGSGYNHKRTMMLPYSETEVYTARIPEGDFQTVTVTVEDTADEWQVVSLEVAINSNCRAVLVNWGQETWIGGANPNVSGDIQCLSLSWYETLGEKAIINKYTTASGVVIIILGFAIGGFFIRRRRRRFEILPTIIDEPQTTSDE